MIKNTAAAVITAVALLGAAAPAFAEAIATSSEDNIPSYDYDFAQARLQEKGINASSVELWGTVVRAFVVGEDGTQTMQFFDKDTLAPLS